MSYEPFPNFVLRTPLYPVNFLKELTSKKTISDQDLKIILKVSVIQEALFLASPPLYNELQKWLKDEINDVKKVEKLKISLLKYLSRMSSRCTPFALFAGCTIGEFGDVTKITIGDKNKHSRHTRLDMNYLVALSQDLAKEKHIKYQLLFYPNTSIYIVGGHMRYVEYQYINTRRQHHISAVDHSVYLERIFKIADQGATIKELAECIIDQEIIIEVATNFIEELIDCQLLVSELEPSVSGPEFLDQILKVLKKIKGVDHIVLLLKSIESQLKKIDECIGNSVENYIEISEKLKILNTTFDLKYLFQTDLFIKTETITLDTSVIDSVKRGLFIVNKISLPPKDTFLNQFIEAFSERFEEREVSLAKALDVEMGVGYKQNQASAELNPLVDDLILPRINGNDTQDIKWSTIHTIFQKKLLYAISNKFYTIKLSDSDFKDFNENWDDLPDTMSTMVEVVMVDGAQKLRFSSIGGSSAANLLGRFCHGDKQLKKHTQQIIDFETNANNDKLLAEIVHLPESRTGNILMRPTLRTFEIPYLAKSLLKKDKQVAINDLTVTVKNGKHIFLKSKKNNKEVLPHLTNAHNYTSNSLPVYQFLCDMQTQGKRGFLGINLGPFTNEYDFIPRIEYENLILSEATWNIKRASISSLHEIMDTDEAFEAELLKFRELFNIPSFALLTEGDNELLINFENLISVKMLLHSVKKKDSFSLKEFLFSEDGLVKSKDGKNYYSNEVILSFYNANKGSI